MRLPALLILLFSSPAYAGGAGDFARGFFQTTQETLERRETQQHIANATSISRADADVLLAEYKGCLESAPPMPELQKTYFEKKIRAALNKKGKAYETKIEQIKAEFLNTEHNNFEKHKQLCNIQFERQKQQIEHQKTIQVMMRQQQAIAAQKAEIEQLKEQGQEPRSINYSNISGSIPSNRSEQKMREMEYQQQQQEQELNKLKKETQRLKNEELYREMR